MATQALTPPTAALDPAAVAAADPTGQSDAMVGMAEHVRDALGRVSALRLPRRPATAQLVVAGMGGSAVGARLAVAVLGDRAWRPIMVADGYALPPWTARDDVVLCSSYSGATEETLSCYDEARRRGAVVVAVTTGGPLGERAEADGVPVIPVPSGLQPRAAIAYSLVSVLVVAALAGAGPPLHAELGVAADLVDRLAAAWGPAGPADGLAKVLAHRLTATVPVVTGGGLTAPVAYRWKCQLNENAKLPAFCAVLPEADHNEICGWRSAPALGAFSAVFLEDPCGDPRLARRMALTAATAGRAVSIVERVRALGRTRAERLLSLVLLGDLVSLYRAVLDGVDPVDVAAITALKASMS